MSNDTKLNILVGPDATSVIGDPSLFDAPHWTFADASVPSLTNISSIAEGGGSTHAPSFQPLDLTANATVPSFQTNAPDGNPSDTASGGSNDGSGASPSHTITVPITDHIDAFNFQSSDPSVTDQPQNQLASVLFDGAVENSSMDGWSSLVELASAQAQSFHAPGSPADTAGPSFEPDAVAAPVSDAKGGGGIGGGGHTGGGGGTTPAPYTTHSGTGVDIHVTYDSSVGNAPAGFTSVVQKVADFFASAFQDSTPITINIDVGYGEVAGMRMGIGAVGESATNLQQLSYSELTSAYSTTGLSLGSSVPTGNLYVSYAQAKALGITITDPQAVDGYVGFSSKSGIFDYNNADGVSSNKYDFYGAVAHEFSEVMGRILLVGGNINNAPSYMAYDFFHFSNPGVQDFSGNGGYFSNDLGTTNLANFNNPSNGGDAGDWASTGTSNSGGSVYDAFNAFDTSGHVEPISHTDLAALQALGYHVNLNLV